MSNLKRKKAMVLNNPNKGYGNYAVNIRKESLMQIYVDKWVLKWCKKYHPEAFTEANKFIKGLLNENK